MGCLQQDLLDRFSSSLLKGAVPATFGEGEHRHNCQCWHHHPALHHDECRDGLESSNSIVLLKSILINFRDEFALSTVAVVIHAGMTRSSCMMINMFGYICIGTSERLHTMHVLGRVKLALARFPSPQPSI